MFSLLKEKSVFIVVFPLVELILSVIALASK